MIKLWEKNTSNKFPMKKSIFDKTITGLVLAVFASTVLALGVAMASSNPIANPFPDDYIFLQHLTD